MKKNMHKQFFLLSIACVMLFSFGFLQHQVFADDYGLEETVSQTDLKSYPQDVPTIIGNVLGTVLSLVAVLFFGLMIYGGLLWMSAHGKEDQEKKALDTIVAGVIGVVIVLGSYAITKLIFGSLGEAVKGDGTKYCLLVSGSSMSCAVFADQKTCGAKTDNCCVSTYANQNACDAGKTKAEQSGGDLPPGDL